MEPIYVFGHKNPDTDSVCGAISYAYLKNKLGVKAEPRVIGEINKETEYVLKYFKIEVPHYLNDVKVQLKDVNFHKNYLLNENKPIIDAFNVMNLNAITGLPLVDDNKKFKGYVSLKEIAADMIYNENLLVDTDFINLVNVLDAKEYLKYDDHITGYAHAATFDDETFINNIELDKESILIVGDREKLIEHAINKGVKMIILVKNRPLSSRLKHLAVKNKINVIISPKSSFKVARVLCLANPIKTIKRGQETIYFNEQDYLTYFNDETSKLKHTNYPIVNNKGVCLGMLRTIDAHEVKRKKVILVDHNMTSQSIDGLYEAEILEIIDHHNIGDINTSAPINFRNMSVGSVNTIIYLMYKENGIRIPQNIAGLMLSGIISDTLLLQSPTTTELDKVVASNLAHTAKLNMKKYGLDMLSSGVDIKGFTANEIVYRDFKTYKINDHSMAIGQVFTTDYKMYKERENELVEELNRLAANNSFSVCALFVTNFLTNDSNILYSENSKRILEQAYNINELHEGDVIKNVVSRKKQMVPCIMDVVEHL
jgi:inorganic diphosphatase